MEYSFTQLEHFYYINCYGSFSKAADALHISKAQISQSIAKLERAMGHKLFHRTTRSVALTVAGENIIPLVSRIIDIRKSIEQEVESLHDLPAGLIRMTCPSAFAECYLAPTLPGFLKKYPAIRLHLRLSSSLLSLEKEKIDLAIRFTHEPPMDKVAKQLGHYQIGYFATPAYLEKKGYPKCVTALGEHDCLVSNTVLHGDIWLFQSNGTRMEYKVSPLIQADNHHVIKQAALQDSGIACLPYFFVRQELATRQLLPVLTSFQMPPIPVYAIFSPARKMVSKMDVFLEYLHNVFELFKTDSVL